MNAPLEKLPCTCRALLATHPHVQGKLAAELLKAGLLASAAEPTPKQLTYADLARLPYLDAVRPKRFPPF